jgi:hypothetical protein
MAILPNHPLLASPVDSEELPQGRLTGNSQRALRCGLQQRVLGSATPVAVAKAL